MTQGRELDALIAEKVMGLGPQCLCPEEPDVADVHIELDGTWFNGHPACRRPIPRPYSIGISAAWDVVEKIKDLKIEGVFLVEYTPHNKSKQWACGWDNYGDLNGSFGMTAPHAICMAALKVVGYIAPGGGGAPADV